MYINYSTMKGLGSIFLLWNIAFSLLQKVPILNKCCSFELSIHQRNQKNFSTEILMIKVNENV